MNTTNVDNKFAKEQEGICDLYWGVAYDAVCALAVGVGGGNVIKNAIGTNSAAYVAAACVITAISVGAFLSRGVSDYVTARVLKMEMRKRQKALAQQNTK